MFRKVSKGKAFAYAFFLALIGWGMNALYPLPNNVCAGGVFFAAAFFGLIWLFKMLRDFGGSAKPMPMTTQPTVAEQPKSQPKSRYYIPEQ